MFPEDNKSFGNNFDHQSKDKARQDQQQRCACNEVYMTAFARSVVQDAACVAMSRFVAYLSDIQHE